MRAIVSSLLGLPDRVLLRLAGLVPRRNRLSYDEYVAALRFYLQEDNASKLFALPDSPAEFTLAEKRSFSGGEWLHQTYFSRHTPRHPKVMEAFDQYPKNRTGHFFLWQHDEKPKRPLVLCVHGFLMGDVKLAEKMFKIQRLFSKGVDVGLFVLPHHGERTTHWIHQRLINPDNLPFTVETIAQTIHDLRSVHLGAKAMGYQRVGLLAASLGGYCSALYATLVNDFDFLFTVVPALDLHAGLQPQKKYLGFTPTTELIDLNNRVLDLITPAKRKPSLAPERIAVLYHDADQLNPPQDVRGLIEAWGIANVTVVPGGHWFILERRARGRAWYAWLAKQGYFSKAR